MNSISQITEIEQWETGKVYVIGQSGLMVKTEKTKVQPSHLQGVKRGRITCFSKSSARRLRETLFSKSVPFALVNGATFTLPFKDLDKDAFIGAFSSSFKRFRMEFVRHFPHSAFIYRVEMQKRGAPHIHAVVWFSRQDLIKDEYIEEQARLALAQFEARHLWLHSLPELWESPRQYFAAERHAVAFDDLSHDDRGALFRYLCDHTSKSKQEQLGWQGRQWGVIGGTNLTSNDLEPMPIMTPKVEAVFWRMMRKILRYRISDECRTKKWKRLPPFGCVYKGGRRRNGVIFVKGGADCVWRCYSLAKSIVAMAPGSLAMGAQCSLDNTEQPLALPAQCAVSARWAGGAR